MTLRILAYHAEGESNPYLVAEAANRRWLTPALRQRGYLVDDQPQPGACYDIVQVHDRSAEIADGVVAPTVTTCYDTRSAPSPAVSVAATLVRTGAVRAAVIYPPVNVPMVFDRPDRGDELVVNFDGHDEFALTAAIAVATRTERPLIIVMDARIEPNESLPGRTGCGRGERVAEHSQLLGRRIPGRDRQCRGVVVIYAELV